MFAGRLYAYYKSEEVSPMLCSVTKAVPQNAPIESAKASVAELCSCQLDHRESSRLVLSSRQVATYGFATYCGVDRDWKNAA